MGNRKERDREERKSNTAAERGGKKQMDKEIERL